MPVACHLRRRELRGPWKGSLRCVPSTGPLTRSVSVHRPPGRLGLGRTASSGRSRAGCRWRRTPPLTGMSSGSPLGSVRNPCRLIVRIRHTGRPGSAPAARVAYGELEVNACPAFEEIGAASEAGRRSSRRRNPKSEYERAARRSGCSRRRRHRCRGAGRVALIARLHGRKLVTLNRPRTVRDLRGHGGGPTRHPPSGSSRSSRRTAPARCRRGWRCR